MRRLKPFLTLGLLTAVLFLSGCSSDMAILDPKGPVAATQKDLILLSIGFMLFIVAVVFILFTVIVYKYREKPENEGYKPPEMEGNLKLEILWTVIPIIIVTMLAIPTVKAIYTLEEPANEKKPLVVHATSVDWKWVFTYPEENIETVNYLYIPEDRPVKFKLTSADSMAALWIPQLGGQEYSMAGMQTEMYLQADEPGKYKGRNANFTGEGFTPQQFITTAMTEEDFEKWVKEVQQTAPKLTQKQYDKLMLQGESEKMTFSSTHLKWVDHAKDAEYAIKARERQGQVPLNPHSREAKEKRKQIEEEARKQSEAETGSDHSGSH
ncbi:cytochrome aa3 quinol oxidase subunit II [Fictibacillus iocasae]|uniref:Quinol oxidase subunit 2 n=1 Tax=Fictibacillus iocasae TaxID=2715437 RepID=A0ABW2NSV5_9BACL